MSGKNTSEPLFFIFEFIDFDEIILITWEKNLK